MNLKTVTRNQLGISDWPLDDQYYSGSVSEYSEASGKHRIDYDDGEVKNLKMKEEN